MEQSAIDVEKPFGEMGLDSVVGVEWIQSLNKEYASNLTVTRIYDYPTIRQLAGFMAKDLLKYRGSSPTQLPDQPPIEANPGLGSCTIFTGQADLGLVPEAHLASKEHLQAGEAGASKTRQASRTSSGQEAVVDTGAIAIVGMSGRYPDARNLTSFWDNLVQGKNAIREIPLSRFDVSDFYDPNPAALGKMYCKWLGALDDIEYFDPLFFHLSPAEAEVMDPQQRLFLEEGYKAFEDAGYSPGLLSDRKCGVYLGIMGHEYDLLLHEQKALEVNVLGTSSAITAARLAYHLNLKGPTIAIDTACSSSLVATHLACQALSNREIDMALVGGVSLYLTSSSYVGMCRAGMLSPDGQCKAFDTSANGFVPGEGVGALVLKRLADAEADHDQIYGLIIGSGINQDGATNGITAPSVKSQIDLVREIYEKYHIDPASISYVEMHGTGTKLGDPIELEALATVFQEKTQNKQYCAIGSVKSNIGHTSAAAGMAGLQKVLLAMKQKKLVPTLHFQQPNEHFDFVASPFYVNTAVQDWHTAAASIPRRAAVSSFGFSGTNAHLVVEEYIPDRRGGQGQADRGRRDSGLPLSESLRVPTSTKTPSLFVLSAKSENQLKSYAQEMKRWIRAHEEQALEDIAFTLQVGRQAMDYRLAIVADSREALLQRLEGFVDNHALTEIHTAQVKKSSLWVALSGPTGNDATLFEADGQSLLRIWCQKKELAKIAQAWVRGVDVDWKLLYGSAHGKVPVSGTIPTAPTLPHRISLPTYPFAQERYWIPIGSGPMVTDVVAKGLTSDASLAGQSSHQADSDGEGTSNDQLVETEVEEVLTIYPERQPSFIQNLRNYRLPAFTPVPSAVSVSLEAGGLQDIMQEALRKIAAEVLKVECEEIEDEHERDM
jgi:acyl transferase domain-containing protein